MPSNPARALHSNKVFGTVGRFLDLHTFVLEIAALASIGWAIWRRDRTTLVLGAGVVAWVVVEIAFALHGWPGLPRYMFEAAGVMVVIAGVLIGRLLVQRAPDPARALLGGHSDRGPDRRRARTQRPVPGADRAQGPEDPASAHGSDQPADDGNPARRRPGAVAFLR